MGPQVDVGRGGGRRRKGICIATNNKYFAKTVSHPKCQNSDIIMIVMVVVVAIINFMVRVNRLRLEEFVVRTRETKELLLMVRFRTRLIALRTNDVTNFRDLL